MSRIPPVDPASTAGKARELLAGVQRRVDDADLADVRRAGFDDGQVVEIVANTVLNVFTNYLNQVAETEIDFPVVRASAAQAA